MLDRRAFVCGILATAFTGPLVSEAQRPTRVYRIGFLALVPGEDTGLMKALLERLHELGYSERSNIVFDYRSAEGHPERLPQLAIELVHAKPDILPGGNITGLADQARDLQGKRLQIMRELIGDDHVAAVLMNPETPFTALALKEVKGAAEVVQMRVRVLEARTAGQVSERIQEATRSGARGLLVLEDPLTYNTGRQIADVTAKLRLPTMYGYRDFAEAGGLMSYRVDRQQRYRRAAEYVDRSLKGAKPADLAVEQPTKFELVINLKTAKTPGLTIPPSLLARADQVIE